MNNSNRKNVTDLKMTIEVWIKQEFVPNSKLSQDCVRKWINDGAIRGTKIGGSYFVYENWQQKPPDNDEDVDNFIKLLKSRRI